MTKEIKAARGRPATFNSKEAKLAALVAIKAGDAENIPSRHLTAQLVEAGLVEIQEQRIEGKRGRPRHVPALTGRARTWVATMERNAAKRAERAAQAEAVQA